MSGVIIDYWGLVNSLSEVLREHPDFSKNEDDYNKLHIHDSDSRLICRQNLLTALILWDHVYINSASLSSVSTESRRAVAQTLRILKGNDIPSVELIHFISTHEMAKEYETVTNQLLNTIKNDMKPQNPDDDKLLLGAGYYLVQANILGVSYLPHPFRAQLLSKAGFTRQMFNASVYTGIIDKEVQKYIESINELANMQLLEIKFPVLYKYIHDKAKGEPLKEFEVAMELRENKKVKQFRKSVKKITNEMESGNITAVYDSFRAVKEICDDVSHSLYNKPFSYGVSIGLTPSISGLPQATLASILNGLSVSVELSGEIKSKATCKLHTTFLTELTRYAFKGI